MEQHFLTIGIASYNYARFLPHAFEAIRRQSFTDYEILYCDDGSTDDSIEVIEGFIRDNPDMDIRLIKGKNGGVMANKNRILDNARGRYVMLCDADDWMEDDCLQTLCPAAQQTQADQIVGAVQLVRDDGSVLDVQGIAPCHTKWTWMMHHATLYKMSIIRENGLRFDPNIFPDDVYFNTIFHTLSGETIFINKIVYNWYRHSASVSRETQNTEWLGCKMLRTILPCLQAAYNAQKDPAEGEKVEYGAIKCYGLAVYDRGAGGPFADFFAEYRQMHTLMQEAFPKYMANPAALKADGKKYLRKNTALILWMTVKLERRHVFRPFLWCYWFLAHSLFGRRRKA